MDLAAHFPPAWNLGERSLGWKHRRKRFMVLYFPPAQDYIMAIDVMNGCSSPA